MLYKRSVGILVPTLSVYVYLKRKILGVAQALTRTQF